MYSVKTSSFEGPLHFLLKLIEQEKFDINQISLAKVADQYLDYIKQIEEKNPEEMADFLIVATKLILIKSKSLLPNLDLGLEEDEESLEEQLKMYREFVLASGNIQKILEKKSFSFSRQKNLISESFLSPPENLTKEKLKDVFREIISSIEPILKLPERAIKKAVSIKEKINYIRDLIRQKASVEFYKIVYKAKDRTEVVVSFLALLELVKNKHISAKQNKLFDDIILKRT